MASVNTRIAKFIADNNLDESIADNLTELVHNCFGDLAVLVAKQVKSTTTAPETTKTKVPKADKMDNPINAVKQDDLNRCTSQTLNEFCKNNGLKVGGNKKDIIDRVWRLLQGEELPEDKSPRSKPKKLVAKSEKHQCCGSNSKGVACGTSATEQCDGKWFCWRHITDANEIIALDQLVSESESDSGSEHSSEPEPEPVKKPKRKAVKI